MLSQREQDLACESIDLVDDGDLIELYVRTNETRYVAELVRRHYRLVATVVGRVVADSHDSQDAVQTTFLVFMQSAKRIRKRASLAAWLYGVAYRTACRCREQSKRQHAGEQSAMLTEQPDTSDSPLAILAKKMQLEALDAELQLVRSTYREVLVEHYLLGYSAVEIAERFNLSQSTVEGRLRRGRRELRTRLLRRGCSLSAALVILRASAQCCASEQAIDASVQTIVNLTTSSHGDIPNDVSSLVAEEVKMISIASSKLGTGLILFTAASTVLGLLSLQSSGQSDQATGQPIVVAAANDSGEVRPILVQEGTRAAAALADPFATPARTRTIPAWAMRSASKVHALLDQAPEAVNFPGTPLVNAIATLRDELNVPMWIDVTALRENGIDEDEPVVLELPARVPLGQVLKLMLKPLGLSYGVDGDILIISAKEKLDRQPAMRIYDLSILADADGEVSQLAQYIQSNIRNLEPDLWESEVWSSELLGEKLIVSASEPAHGEIAMRLADLARQLGKLPPTPQATAVKTAPASADPFADNPFVGNPRSSGNSANPFADNPFVGNPKSSGNSANPFGAAPKQDPFGNSDPFGDNPSATESNPFGS